jgi:hypothetical protein
VNYVLYFTAHQDNKSFQAMWHSPFTASETLECSKLIVNTGPYPSRCDMMHWKVALADVAMSLPSHQAKEREITHQFSCAAFNAANSFSNDFRFSKIMEILSTRDPVSHFMLLVLIGFSATPAVMRSRAERMNAIASGGGLPGLGASCRDRGPRNGSQP